MELRPYKRRFEILSRIALSARHTLAEDLWMRSVLADAVDLLHADRGTLYWLDADTGDLWTRIRHDAGELGIRLKVGEGLAGWVAMAGVPLRINDVLVDDRFDARWDRETGYHTRTVLAVPLLATTGHVIGVLQALNSTRGSFDEEDVTLAQAVAEILALTRQAYWSASLAFEPDEVT